MSDRDDDDIVRHAEQLGERLGYRFADLARLKRALTHASVRSQKGKDYQRLEFLGDRVLGLAVADMLFREFPDASEGELSVRLNALVNAEALSDFGEEIDLDRYIRTGGDLKSTKGRRGKNLRADVVEALIAVIFLEGGMQAFAPIVDRFWKPMALKEGAEKRDAKTRLQEWLHRQGKDSPVYQVEGREGPDHDPLFTVSVHVDGHAPETGSGNSKRQAEQAAARAYLQRENIWE